MQTINLGILSLALLAGCDLIPSSDSNSSGALTPPLYTPGRSGSYVVRDGGADGIPDARPPSDTNGTLDAKGDVYVAPDAPGATYPTKIWTGFGRSFATCEWFTSATGLCTTRPAVGTSGTLVFDLYKTDDGGKTMSRVSTVDTGNKNAAATVDVYLPSSRDLWFVTGASGTSPSGTIFNSTDGGTNWYSKASNVFSVLTGNIATQVPLRQIRSGSGALWLLADGALMLRSKDGGGAWTVVSAPTDFGAATTRSLLPVGNQLYLSYLNGTTMGLYAVSNAGDFSSVQGAIPAGSLGSNATTWLHTSPNVGGIFMSDRSPAPNWSTPFWIYALVAGTTPIKIMSAATAADTKLVGLRDGIVVESTALAVYLSGVFSEAGSSYLQVRKSTDGGATWTVLHSEPAVTSVYASLSVDSLGKIHAMRLTSDSTGPTYDAHTIIE